MHGCNISTCSVKYFIITISQINESHYGGKGKMLKHSHIHDNIKSFIILSLLTNLSRYSQTFPKF